ncbi:DUF4232 domain-containing protein [Actinoplanes sp. NPDC051346]|uniref:DUF4232 domain-containing protein n=1 Tax=Actinoplanes sp. NPDC051346 TaxID=3155048 RepID=UPI00341F3202
MRAYRRAALLTVAALLAGCAAPGTSTGSGLSGSGPPGSGLSGSGPPGSGLSGSGPPGFPSEPPPARFGQPRPSTTAETCPTEGVRFEVGEVDAAMGLRVRGITLVNCGSRTYRLNGYPAVRPLDEDRAALKVRVLHGVKEIVGSGLPWDGPPKPVVLRPGQRAGSGVAWRNTYDDTREPPVTVKFLDIAPLADRPYRLVDLGGGLDLGSTGRIAVSAWSLLPDADAPAFPTGRPVPGASASEPVETGGPLP